MAHRKLFLVVSFVSAILVVLLPVTADAYMAYSSRYGSSYGGGSYYVGYSQPSVYFTGAGLSYRKGAVPAPTPEPRPVPNPTPPYSPPRPSPQPIPAPVPTPQPPDPTPETGTLTADEQLLLKLVNTERAKYGSPALAVDPRLVNLAQLKSKDMLDLGYFDHLSPTYGSFGDMLRGANVGFYLAAENIGLGGSVSRIFSAFMDSPGHRGKILDARYTFTGIGIVYREGKGYRVTQLFLKPR